MKLEMSGPYCSGLRVFRINHIDADTDDFGVSEDRRPEAAPEYGCGDRKFRAYEWPSMGVLEKYLITFREWEEIGEKLEAMLDWGCCSLCE